MDIASLNVSVNYGSCEIATMISAVLYGILLSQCHYFFSHLEGRMTILRYSIWLLLFFNTFHLLMAMSAVYWYTILAWGNVFKAFHSAPWTTLGVVIATAISNLIIQGWYTYRIKILSENNVLLVCCLGCLITVTFGLVLALSGYFLTLPNFGSYEKGNWLLFLAHGFDALTNLVVSVVYCIYVARWRRYALPRTRSLINLLVIYAINSGLYGVFIPLVNVILRIIQPDNLLFYAFYIPYSALYSTSLLASLNARDWFHNGREPVSIPLSFISRNQSNMPVRTNVPFANTSSTPTLVRSPEIAMGRPANWDLRSDATMEPQKVSSSSEM